VDHEEKEIFYKEISNVVSKQFREKTSTSFEFQLRELQEMASISLGDY